MHSLPDMVLYASPLKGSSEQSINAGLEKSVDMIEVDIVEELDIAEEAEKLVVVVVEQVES